MTGLEANGPARCYERHGPRVAKTIIRAVYSQLHWVLQRLVYLPRRRSS